MKRLIFSVMSFCLLGISVFAGDVSVFKDIGFSKDGNTYIFGTYGKTDKKFIPYAEIYTVDVAQNAFLPGKVFKLKDTSCNKTSKELYEELAAKKYSEIKQFECYEPLPEHVLYIMDDESKKSTDEIVFKSFEESDYTYSVKLHTVNYGGKSSFYIDVKVFDNLGQQTMAFQAGNPQIKRANVTNYRIVKISTSKDRKSIVFVVEKTVEDETGVSIRYMVETKKLDKPIDAEK